MGTSVKQEGKYQSMYAPSPSYPSRMAGNVVTVPSELTKEIDPRNRYREIGEAPFGTYAEESKALNEPQPTAQQQQPMPQPQQFGQGQTLTDFAMQAMFKKLFLEKKKG